MSTATDKKETHSTFNMQELPVKSVTMDDDGNVRITWIHRQRFVGLEWEETHVVEDTMSIVINPQAAQSIYEAIESMLSDDQDGEWIGSQDG